MRRPRWTLALNTCEFPLSDTSHLWHLPNPARWSSKRACDVTVIDTHGRDSRCTYTALIDGALWAR